MFFQIWKSIWNRKSNNKVLVTYIYVSPTKKKKTYIYVSLLCVTCFSLMLHIDFNWSGIQKSPLFLLVGPCAPKFHQSRWWHQMKWWVEARSSQEVHMAMAYIVVQWHLSHLVSEWFRIQTYKKNINTYLLILKDWGNK